MTAGPSRYRIPAACRLVRGADVTEDDGDDELTEALTHAPRLDSLDLIRQADTRLVQQLCRYGARVVAQGRVVPLNGAPAPYVVLTMRIRGGRAWRILLVLSGDDTGEETNP